jgi:osmotically-inducible protein OsmY
MARTTPKVRAIQNELAVGPVTDLNSRTNDTLITSKVKTRFVEANKFQINHVKVVTERSTVYLLGLVRRGEGDSAAEIASTTSGVQRVVKVFEYVAG